MSMLSKNIDSFIERCACRNRHSFIGYVHRHSFRLNKCRYCSYYFFKMYYTCSKDFTNPFPVGCIYFHSNTKPDYVQLSLFDYA